MFSVVCVRPGSGRESILVGGAQAGFAARYDIAPHHVHQALIEGLGHARNRYRAGYASYLEELDAQRGLLNVELGLVQLQETRLLNSVALYQALGGGWR